MKIKNLVKLVIVIAVFIAAVGSVYFLLSKDKQNKSISEAVDSSFGWKFPVAKFPSTGTGNGDLAYSTVRDPGGVPQGLPVRLKIPVISVNSAIEDAHITQDGRMDVPAGSVNVAWFALGPHPGQVGSAVIGGHFGIDKGVPFVFYNLDKVKVGDKIYVIDDKNNTLAFQVRSIKSFNRDDDATTVFTSSDGLAHLNLITCEGVWNQVNGTYPQRLVLFTDSIPYTAPAPSAAPKLPTTVITPIPSSPSPSTSPKPLDSSEPLGIPIPPSQTLLASATSLYGNPVDGTITSILLISIAFIIFKIIRR